MAYISKEATDLRNQLRLFRRRLGKIGDAQELDVFLFEEFFPFIEGNDVLKNECRMRATFVEKIKEDTDYVKHTTAIEGKLKKALYHPKVSFEEWKDNLVHNESLFQAEKIMQPYQRLRKVLASLAFKNSSLPNKNLSREIVKEINALEVLVRGGADELKAGVFEVVENYRLRLPISDKDFLSTALLAVIHELDKFLVEESKKKGGWKMKFRYDPQTKTFFYQGQSFTYPRKKSKQAKLCDYFYVKCPRLDTSLPWPDIYRHVEKGQPCFETPDEREKVRGWIKRLNKWSEESARIGKILDLKEGIVVRLK